MVRARFWQSHLNISTREFKMNAVIFTLMVFVIGTGIWAIKTHAWRRFRKVAHNYRNKQQDRIYQYWKKLLTDPNDAQVGAYIVLAIFLGIMGYGWTVGAVFLPSFYPIALRLWMLGFGLPTAISAMLVGLLSYRMLQAYKIKHPRPVEEETQPTLSEDDAS